MKLAEWSVTNSPERSAQQQYRYTFGKGKGGGAMNHAPFAIGRPMAPANAAAEVKCKVTALFRS